MTPIRAAVFDLGGVLEVVDDDLWQDAWIARWEGLAFRARIRTALSLDEATLALAMAEWWDSYCGELDVAMRDFVASLKPGLIVASLSNSGDGARREDERRYRFEKLFDVMIYSHEVGVEKPDPAIYRLTEERLGVHSNEIVFLDDREMAVAGARAAGWHAVLHTSTQESISAMRAIIAAHPRL